MLSNRRLRLDRNLSRRSPGGCFLRFLARLRYEAVVILSLVLQPNLLLLCLD